MNSCIIYFHFPFDGGYTIGREDSRINSLIETIRASAPQDDMQISRKPIEISRYEIVEDDSRQEYFPLITPINLNVQCDGYSPIRTQEYEATLSEFDVNLFDTGIAIGHLKFKVSFASNITPKLLLEAQSEIYNRLASFTNADEGPEKNLSNLLRNMMKTIRDSLRASFGAQSGQASRSYNESPDYIYPLFYLGPENGAIEIKDFLCLMYLKSDNSMIRKEELDRAYQSNSLIYEGGDFLTMWEGSIAGGPLVTERKADSQARILEISSYVWYSMYVIDSILADNGLQISGSDKKGVTLKRSEDQIDAIRKLRNQANDVLETYRNIRISLWVSVILIFDKILRDSWRIDRIENSIREKIALLNLAYEEIVDEIERKHNLDLNRTVLSIQRIGFALAAVIAILPFVGEALKPQSNPSMLGSTVWLPVLVSIIIVAITLGLGFAIENTAWKRRMKKYRFE